MLLPEIESARFSICKGFISSQLTTLDYQAFTIPFLREYR